MNLVISIFPKAKWWADCRSHGLNHQSSEHWWTLHSCPKLTGWEVLTLILVDWHLAQGTLKLGLSVRSRDAIPARTVVYLSTDSTESALLLINLRLDNLPLLHPGPLGLTLTSGILFKLPAFAFSSGIIMESKAEKKISTFLKTLEVERLEKWRFG